MNPSSEAGDQLSTGNTISLCEGDQDVEAGFNPHSGKVEVFPKPNLPEGQGNQDNHYEERQDEENKKAAAEKKRENSVLNPYAEEFVPTSPQQQIPASAVEMPGNMMTPLDVQFGDLEFESTENSAFTFGGNESVSRAYSSSVASSTSSSMSNHVSGQIGQLSQASDSMIPTSRITPSPLSALEQSSPRNNALYQPSSYTTPVKKEPVENKQELKRENRYPPVSLKDRKIAELEKANLEKDRRIAELEGFQDLHEDKPEKKKQKAGILQGYSEVVKQKGSANTNVSNLPSTAAVEQETGSSSKDITGQKYDSIQLVLRGLVGENPIMVTQKLSADVQKIFESEQKYLQEYLTGCSQKLVIEMAVDLVLRPLLERLLEKHLKKHPEKLQLHQSRRDKLTIPETDKNDRFDLHALCRLLLEKPKNAGSGKKIGWLADAQKTIELCRDEIRYELAHGDRESCISPAVYTKLVEELTKREKELEEIIKKL